MREIKFRAWNSKDSYWAPFEDDHDYELKNDGIGRCLQMWVDGNPQKEGVYIISQFTGLNDKTGKEIYEGDIVIWKVESIERRAAVYYDEKQACFWMGKDKNTNMLVLNDWMRGEYEVLGNIHQNPELL